MKAEILVCEGNDDPFVPAEHVAGLILELNQAGADWQLEFFRRDPGLSGSHAMRQCCLAGKSRILLIPRKWQKRLSQGDVGIRWPVTNFS